MSSKGIALFATRSDYDLLLSEIEGKREIIYVKFGVFRAGQLLCYEKFSQIPSLGIARKGVDIQEDKYLVIDRAAEVQVGKVDRGRFDSPLHFVDQGNNPQSITFQPGGLYEKRCLISGSIGTAVRDSTSDTLYRLFTSSVRKHFVKVKSAWLGPEALLFFRNEMCLTQSASLPPTYCLCD